MEQALNWFGARQGRVRYSMDYRMGQIQPGYSLPSFDCSSALYLSLIEAGIFPTGMRIGNTDSLFADLEAHGFVQVPIDGNGNAQCQRGDVFVWGRRGASSGAAGHTGMFVNANDIIHCNAGYNGITVNNHDTIWGYNGGPAYTFYRYVGKVTPPSAGVSIGDMAHIKDSHVVTQRATVNGITQVAAESLYLKNFDWTDNGIAVAGIAKVDGAGYRLEGVTNPGERFVVPGSFRVADIANDAGITYVLLSGVGGYEVWVAAGAVSKGSKAVPVARPVQQTQPPQTTPPVTKPPVTTPPQTQPPVTKPPETQAPVTLPPETQAPVETNPPKEDKPVAFSREQQRELAIATQQVLDANTAFEPVISEKVKTIAYFVTDTFAIGSTFVLTILAILGQLDGNTAIYISAACTTLALGLKATFRLSAKEKKG